MSAVRNATQLNDAGHGDRRCTISSCSHTVAWTGRGRPPKYCPAHRPRSSAQHARLIGRLAHEATPRGFSRDLRRAIEQSGQSLATISKQLAAIDIFVSASTLSAWQRGHCEPVRDGRVHALERVLGLRAGALAVRLAGGPQQTRSNSHDREPASSGYRSASERVQVELSALAAATLLSDYVITEIDDDVMVDGARIELTVRQTVRAVRAGVDSAWFFYWPEADRPHVLISSATGCRIGRRLKLTDGRYATELLFDRRLERGEDHTYGLHVRQQPGGAARPGYGRSIVEHTVEKLKITVCFTRSPSTAWLYCRSGRGEGNRREQVRVDRAMVTLDRTSPDPAEYGIGWSY